MHPCAAAAEGDGIDQNCDGADGLAKISSTSTTTQVDLCGAQP